MDDYLDIKIDVFEHTDQRARVRRNLTIHGLMDEILKEFDDISAVSPEKYAIYLKGMDKPLNRALTITELDLQPQDELVFEYKHQNIRENLLPNQVAYLHEDKTGKLFEIQWSPALIGRPTAEVEHNLMLAVNVQDIPQGMTISRKHAQITFSDDAYYLESLAETNPVTVNGKDLRFGTSMEIKNNDKLTFGNQKVPMTFLTQQQAKSPPAERKAQSEKVGTTPQVEHKTSAQVEPLPAPPPPFASQPPQVKAEPEKSVPGSSAPCLIVEQSANPEIIGKRLEIDVYPYVLGRSLPLLSAENLVSRRHAEINFDAQSATYSIQDLKSTNGVKLDGAPLNAEVLYELKPGMKVALGQELVLKFET